MFVNGLNELGHLIHEREFAESVTERERACRLLSSAFESLSFTAIKEKGWKNYECVKLTADHTQLK